MEADHFEDADLEAMLDQLHITHPKNFNCDNARPIDRMCINPNCKEVSLFCSHYDCEKCKVEAHTECSSIPFNGVTSRLQKMTERHKKFIRDICEI